MKKMLFIATMLFLSISNAQAQVAYERAKFFDNFYIGAEVGLTNRFHNKISFPLKPVAGLKLGKDFTPIFGANLSGTVDLGTHGFYVDWPGKIYMNSKTFVKLLSFGLNGTVNLTNLFSEYRPDRTFELGLEAGLATATVLGDEVLISYNNYGDNTELTSKLGMTFAWNLGELKAWQIYLEPAMGWNLTHGPGDAVKFNGATAQIKLLLGIKYKFMTSNGTHNFKVYNIGDMNNELNELRAQLAAKPKEVVKEVEKEVVREVVKEVPANCESMVFVTFEQAKSYLTQESKNVLDAIKVGAHVQVVGTASPEGTKRFNDKIAQKRADVVAKYLKDRGVIVDKASGKGVTGVTSNRLAVVIAK